MFSREGGVTELNFGPLTLHAAKASLTNMGFVVKESTRLLQGTKQGMGDKPQIHSNLVFELGFFFFLKGEEQRGWN